MNASRRSFLKGAGAALVSGTAVTVATREWRARKAEEYSEQPVDLLAEYLAHFEGERFNTVGYLDHVDRRDISVFETERNAIREAHVDLLDIQSPERDASLPAFAYRNGFYSDPLPREVSWDDTANEPFSLYGRVEQYADMETGHVGHRFELHDAYDR